MTHIIGFFLCLAIAICTGFGATWVAVHETHGFERVDMGAWSTWQRAGSAQADPYTKAIIAKTGEVPLQSAEGLSIISSRDDEGRKLKANCTYIISGALPASQVWTLTSYNKQGQILVNKAGRASLTSHEIIRDASNNFEIVVSANVQPGNWLPIADTSPFELLLRLYDVAIGHTPSELKAAINFNIKQKSCI